jgi:hypothetical protein
MKKIAISALAVFLTTSTALTQEVKPTAPPEPSGMKALFNGRDLAGWDGDKRLWTVKDGAIRGETTKENPTYGNTFLLYVGDQSQPVNFKDFELRLSFRIESGNAGVQYRSALKPFKADDKNKWVVAGYQAEVENTPGKVGFLYHESGRAWLVSVGDKVEIGEDGKPQVVGKLGDNEAIGKTYKKSDWNDYDIPRTSAPTLHQGAPGHGRQAILRTQRHRPHFAGERLPGTGGYFCYRRRNRFRCEHHHHAARTQRFIYLGTSLPA